MVKISQNFVAFSEYMNFMHKSLDFFYSKILFIISGTNGSSSTGIWSDFTTKVIGAIRRLCKIRRSPNSTKIQPIAASQLSVLN